MSGGQQAWLVVLADALHGASDPTHVERLAADVVIEAARLHGVLPLLADRLCTPPGQVAPELCERLGRERALAAALDTLRQPEVVRVIEELAASGVDAVLLKGAALAHTLYANPAQRPRFDTDLLIRKADLRATEAVMARLGYHPAPLITGDLVVHQIEYQRRDAAGVWHLFDCHWKLSNRHVVADVLTWEEIVRDAIAIPGLGPHARGPSHVHALLLACTHRVAHHTADERLIWLEDIHRLVAALSPSEAGRFASLAIERRVQAICADGLSQTRRLLGTPLPPALGDLVATAARTGAEPSAALLAGAPSRARELASDLKAVAGWPQRLRLIREHAFPSPAYIRSSYAVSSRTLLPALYTHRLVRGVWRLLRSAGR